MNDLLKLFRDAVNNPHISGFDSSKIGVAKKAMSDGLNSFKKEQEKVLSEKEQSVNLLTEALDGIENNGLSSNSLDNLKKVFKDTEKSLDEESKKQIEELIKISEKELINIEQERQNKIKSIEENERSFG